MSPNRELRPVSKIYRCDVCGEEIHLPNDHVEPGPCQICGGEMRWEGEEYPAEEER